MFFFIDIPSSSGIKSNENYGKDASKVSKQDMNKTIKKSKKIDDSNIATEKLFQFELSDVAKEDLLNHQVNLSTISNGTTFEGNF